MTDLNKTIIKFISDIENSKQDEIEKSVKFIAEKLDKLSLQTSEVNQEIFLNDSFILQQLKEFLRKNSKVDINNLTHGEIVRQYIMITSTITKDYKEKINRKNLLLLLKEINALIIQNQNFEVIDRNLFESQINTYIKLDKFLNENKNELKSIGNVYNHLTTKKDYLHTQIQKSFSTLLSTNFLLVNENTIKINKNIESINLSIFKIVLDNFPYLIISFLQNIYDYFLIHFNSDNITIEINEDNDTHIIFQHKLNNKIKNLKEKANLFETFVELLQYFVQNFITLHNYNKDILENDKFSIRYDIQIGGGTKKTENNFIFVLSYIIKTFYKIIKEDINLSFTTNENTEDIFYNLKQIWSDYKTIINNFTNTFESISNQKFYDNEDFNFKDVQTDNFKEDFFKFRNLIKDSYTDIQSKRIKKYKIVDLLNQVFNLALNEEESNLIKDVDNKILNLDYNVNISISFIQFLKELINHINKIKTDKDNQSYIINQLSKIFTLLNSLYNLYGKMDESSDFSTTLILHNNIESMLLVINFLFVLDNDLKQFQKLDEYIKQISFFFKNITSQLMSQLISNFFSQLIEILTSISFSDIRFERNSKTVEKALKNALEILFKFFDYFKELANDKDLLFNINYIVTQFFNMLNKIILQVRDYSTDDINALLKILKNVTAEIKKNINSINTSDYLKAEYNNALENNLKYKKFEEIILVLNANLKEIRNFIITSDYNINIDPIELVELIEACYENSPQRQSLIDFINEKLLK